MSVASPSGGGTPADRGSSAGQQVAGSPALAARVPGSHEPVERGDRWLALAATLLAGAVLLLAAIGVQGQIWEAAGALDLFWWLLVLGAAFAILARLALPWPTPPSARPAVADPRGPSDSAGLPVARLRDDRPADPAGLPLARAREMMSAKPIFAPRSGAGGEGHSLAGGEGLPAPGESDTSRPRLALTGPSIVVAALCLEAASLVMFRFGRPLNVAWLLHWVAAGVFLYGLWRSTGRQRDLQLPAWTRIDTAWAVALTVLGFLPRAWRIDAIPQGIWFDEAQRGLEVLRMIAERGYRPIFASGILQEPTGLWYLMLPLIAAIGRDPVALRLPVAIGGALGIGALYVLAWALYGRRVAIVAAGLGIGLAWHLNFSRIALPAVLSVTCDTLAAALFVLGLRRGSRLLLGAAGVVCGLGFYFYYTSQLMPFVLVVAGGHQLVAGRLTFLKRNAVGLALCVLGFVLVTGPFIQFALANPQQFSQRAGTVSVFKEVEDARSWAPLVNNVRAHLLMFNVRGDPNGRHNWTGRPMLDPVVGGLAVAGLALALSRFWRLEQVLLLAWIPAALAGGIFSLTWEAPQSHRAIDALVPAVLLAALPIGVLWLGLDRLVERLPQQVPTVSPSRRRLLGLAGTGLAVGCLVLANVVNLDRFFARQQRDSRTWLEFSSAQTEAGRQIAALPRSTKAYLEPSWVGYPSIRFVDVLQHEYVPFDPGAHLPITDDAAAIFIADRPPVAARIAAMYPAAERIAVRTPDGGGVAVHGFILNGTALAANRGLDAVYASPAGAIGPIHRREATVDTRWPVDAPLPAPFSATWTGTLTVPMYGVYRLRLEGPGSLALTLDGIELLRGGAEGTVRLPRGNHALRLRGTDLGREPVRLLMATGSEEPRPVDVRLLNVSPVETTGLLGRVYRGEEPRGDPAAEQVDPSVDLRVHFLPAPRPYTLEWTGAIRIDRTGEYRFGVSSVGIAAIWVDGEQLASNSVPNGFADGPIPLEAGWHDIRVRFVDNQNFAFVAAYWQPPGGGREIIPTAMLRPWPAQRVAAARPEDADLAVATTAVGDAAPPALQPVTPPATARDRRELGDGQVVAPSSALTQPRGVAVGPDGTLYVADGVRKAIVEVSTSGATRQLGEGHLKEPSAVAVLPDGGQVVADAGAGAVLRLGPNGEVGERLFPTMPLYGPRGLTAGPNGELVLADTGNDRVLVRAADGAVTTVAGFVQPTGAILLPDGTLLVAETGAAQVVNARLDGSRVATWQMPKSTTVIGPHVAMLPGGGWAVSAPEERAVLARPAGAAEASRWVLGGAVKKPSGLAVGPGGLLVGDADGGVVRQIPLP